MTGRIAASREFLLGLYALEGGTIDPSDLTNAVRDWSRSPDRSLSEILIGGGLLDPATVERLEGRIGRELDRLDNPGSTATFRPSDDEGGGVAEPSGVESDRSGPRFRAVRLQARGGLGEVFLAFDAELNRSVALKELQPHRAHDPASQSRFLREAEITGMLEHPGIVPVYSLNRHADGRPYYAMRLVEGGTLREAIEGFHRSTHREGKEVAFRRLLRSVVYVCNAVAYAHSRGVIHRDLKPENIMLGPFGETLVVDWGIAKRFLVEDGESLAEDEDVPVDPSMTRPGSVIGTPRYMSPEQASGDLGRVGPLSDIYSLGAILYCVLVGHDAFQDGEMPGVLDRVRRGIFAAPRRARRSVDPSLETICLKAMSHDPEARHASALDLAGEIEAWLADVRYQGEQERALSQSKASLARLSLERAHHCFGRKAHEEGMLWLARALEDAPSEPPHLEIVIRTSLSGWHLGSKMMERRLKLGGDVHAIDFCPDGRKLATASADGSARLWDVATGSALSPPLTHKGSVRVVAFRPDGKSIATGGDDGMIRSWDAVTGEGSGESIRSGSPVTALCFSPDGSRIGATSGPNGPSLWDASTGRPMDERNGRESRTLAVAFSPDGSTLAVGCLDGLVHLLDASTGETLGGPLAHGSAVSVLAFDPSGQRILTGSLDGSLRLWDIERRSEVLTLAGQGEVRCLAFRPGGEAFATASDEGSARLRDPATGGPIGERLDHGSRVDCLAFSPDGSLIATGAQDGKIRLWCASTGLPIGPPLALGPAVRRMVFSREGGRLAASGPDATVRCWRLPIPIEASVERVACWVRILTNLDFDAGDSIGPLDGSAGWDHRRRLNDLGGPPLR